eukprot:CAMPEP_0182445324 /NCGR_PEP_ID=MMETSP1172-20130603/3488_1 /TAXON_ID=708627 /ORGANISM="Timspurckia oligopyrenoides, Strain CCMP3278" /LENGTH=251 /DNA_ID=CAMNT_0024641073 /DNA_START=212 /DNA_END=967 /DNA_ORIENTATION=+
MEAKIKETLDHIEKKHGYRPSILEDLDVASVDPAQYEKLRKEVGADFFEKMKEEPTLASMRNDFETRLKMLADPNYDRDYIDKMRKDETANQKCVDTVEAALNELTVPNKELEAYYEKIIEAFDIAEKNGGVIPPIDWGYYREQLGPMVDEIKAEFEEEIAAEEEAMANIKITEESRAKIAAAFKPLEDELVSVLESAETTLIEVDKAFVELMWMRDNVDTMTLDQFFERYPHHRIQLEKEVAEEKWIIPE